MSPEQPSHSFLLPLPSPTPAPGPVQVVSRLGWAAPQWDHKEGVGTASDGVWLIACELTLNQTVSLTLTLIPTLTLTPAASRSRRSATRRRRGQG